MSRCDCDACRPRIVQCGCQESWRLRHALDQVLRVVAEMDGGADKNRPADIERIRKLAENGLALEPASYVLR